MYICHQCHRVFAKLLWLEYKEYEGASIQKEPVSECCGAEYSEANEDPEDR